MIKCSWIWQEAQPCLRRKCTLPENYWTWIFPRFKTDKKFCTERSRALMLLKSSPVWSWEIGNCELAASLTIKHSVKVKWDAVGTNTQNLVDSVFMQKCSGMTAMYCFSTQLNEFSNGYWEGKVEAPSKRIVQSLTDWLTSNIKEWNQIWFGISTVITGAFSESLC